MIVERLTETTANQTGMDEAMLVKKSAFENLKALLRSATSSITSVPKPMKHLFQYLPILRSLYFEVSIDSQQLEKLLYNKSTKKKDLQDIQMMSESRFVVVPLSQECRAICADIISVMCMAYGRENHQDALFFKNEYDEIQIKRGFSPQEVAFWGHEYVRHLSMEIMAEFALVSGVQDRIPEFTRELMPIETLQRLAVEILPFFIQHNAEADAVDLSLELDILDPFLFDLMNFENYKRVTLYLSQFFSFEEDPMFRGKILNFLIKVYDKVGDYNKAFLSALKMNNIPKLYDIFLSCNSFSRRQQLAFLLARCRLNVLPSEIEVLLPSNELEVIKKILSNEWLSKEFISLAAEEFKVLEPKLPEDVYKSHLVESPFGRFGGLSSNSATSGDTWMQNLANSIVNGFLNVGHGSEKYLFLDDLENPNSTNGASELYKNKESRLIASVASLGLIHLWNIEGGTEMVDRYLGSEDKHIKSGGLLALGVLSTGIRNEAEPAFAMITEALQETPYSTVKISALLGLGIAYAGTRKAEIRNLVLGHMVYAEDEWELMASLMASMAASLVFCSSADGEVVSAFIQLFMEVPVEVFQKNRSMSLLFYMSFGLLFLGVEDSSDGQKPIETIVETLQIIPDENMRNTLIFLVRMMSLVGSGNVLFVQECLKLFDSIAVPTNEPFKVVEDKMLFALFGIVLMPLGDEVSSEMTLRILQQCIHYLPIDVRCLVPLAISLLNVSNPTIKLIDLLSKYSHDPDPKMSQISIFALGLIGLGTNQSKINSLLRDLWKYYGKEPNGSHLFFIRLTFGFLSAGKGLVSGSPLYHDRQLIDKTALASMMLFLTAFLDDPTWWIRQYPALIYILTPCISPRALVTLKVSHDGSVFSKESELSASDSTSANKDISVLSHQSVDVRVGHPIDVVGQAGRPKSIAGFQTHLAPVLLAFDERAELATDSYVALTDVLEGFVILEKNPNFMDTD